MNIAKTLTAGLAAFTLGLTLVATTLPAAAQGEGHVVPGHPRVNQVNSRVENQRDRIQQGLRSGTMTKSEAMQLKTQRQGIKTEEHIMRADDNGHLTRADQKALNQQLNFRSKEIYQDKHTP